MIDWPECRYEERNMTDWPKVHHEWPPDTEDYALLVSYGGPWAATDIDPDGWLAHEPPELWMELPPDGYGKDQEASHEDDFCCDPTDTQKLYKLIMELHERSKRRRDVMDYFADQLRQIDSRITDLEQRHRRIDQAKRDAAATPYDGAPPAHGQAQRAG